MIDGITWASSCCYRGIRSTGSGDVMRTIRSRRESWLGAMLQQFDAMLDRKLFK